jgi:hypothetical protein
VRYCTCIRCVARAPPAPQQPQHPVCRDPALQPLIQEISAAFNATIEEKQRKGAHPAAQGTGRSLVGAGYGATDVMLVVGWQRGAFLMAALKRLLRADSSEEVSHRGCRLPVCPPACASLRTKCIHGMPRR